MAARRRAPAKPKVAAEPPAPTWRPRPGTEYRVRPLSGAGPHDWPRPAYETADDFDAELTAATWREEGVPCIVEQAYDYGYGAPERPVLTVKQVAREGLAKQVSVKRGKTTSTHYVVTPEGHRRLTESMKR